MFNEQQEEWLGEVMDTAMEKDFHTLEDPEGRLQKVGERLLAQLPPSQVHYRFVIVDSPELSSFGLAGGRIYIFRRMIGFIQNEDELAALLGHEIGHMIMHQAAIDVSRWFRELGITSITDRQDIFNRWNQLLDNWTKRSTKHEEKREEQEQIVADRIGLYAMTRAGYRTSEFINFADRLLQTKGKTGSFWGDLLGARPEYKRLREIVHSSTPLPTNCIAARPAEDPTFAAWRESIIASRRAVLAEAVPGLLVKTALQIPLRSDLTYAQFSPDGTYMLAQDESSIFVLSREPLRTIFRIDAPDSNPAHFTPDSQGIVFYDKELRVEKWSLQSQRRISAHAINATTCWGSELSPTGEVLACARPRFEVQDPLIELQLIDVATGQPFLTHEKFYELTFADWINLELTLALNPDETPRLFNVRFSPDGRYVVVSHRQKTLAYDLVSRTELKVPASIKSVTPSAFTFIAPDQIAGYNFQKHNMEVLRFPSGQTVNEFSSGSMYAALWPAAKGDFVLGSFGLVSGMNVIDLKAQKITMGTRLPALAIYDPFYFTQENGGDMVFGQLAEKKVLNHMKLPESPLGVVRAAAFSPDGKWLALSSGSGGGIWSLEGGNRSFYLSKLYAAAFDQDGKLTIKFDRDPGQAARVVEYEPVSKAAKKLYEFSSEPGQGRATDYATQVGESLITVKRSSENWFKREYLMSVRDIHTNNSLWEHTFHGQRPSFFYSPEGKSLSFLIRGYENVKTAAKESGLEARLDVLEGKKDACIVQQFDALTGKMLGAVLVDTGKASFAVKKAITVGDYVLVNDSNNRTLVFSLKSGAQLGKVFGHVAAISSSGNKLLVENDRGVADLYETRNLHALAHFTFPAGIAHAQFAGDENTMWVLTADQSVYSVRTSGQEQATNQ